MHDLTVRMRKVLAQMLRPGTSINSSVAEMLLLIDEAEAVASSSDRRSLATYVVEKVRDREVLTERRRDSSPHPLRAPKAVYSATAESLAQAARHHQGLTFDELRRAVRKRADRAEAYQVRICLRFWRSAHPPMVDRVEREYVLPPGKAGEIENWLYQVEQLWHSLNRRLSAGGRRKPRSPG